MNKAEIRKLENENPAWQDLKSKKHVLEVTLFGPKHRSGYLKTSAEINEIAHRLVEMGYPMGTVVKFWQSV